MVVNILAGTSRFVAGIADARTSLGKFKKEVTTADQIASGFRKTLGLLGGAFAASQIISGAKAAAASLDQLGKTADKLAVSAESLQGLRFGAAASGLDPKSIDSGLQTLQTRLSEVAVTGKGKAAPALKELGLEAARLVRLPVDQQLYRVANALQDAGTQANKMRLATMLLGDEGASLTAMMKDGARGLRDFHHEAKSLGIMFSREEIAKVEAANDAFAKLKVTLGGLGQKIVIELAPDVERVVNNLAEAADGMRHSRVGKEGGFFDRQFPWTKALFGKGLTGQFEWQKRMTDRLVKEDLAAGAAMGSRSFADIMREQTSGTGGDFFTTGKASGESESLDEWVRERNARARAQSYFLRQGFDAINRMSRFTAENFSPFKAEKSDPDNFGRKAIKAILEAQKQAKSGTWALVRDSLILGPGLTERGKKIQEKLDKDKKDKEDREKREREKETRLAERQGPNAALEKDTAEAFRAIAEARMPKMQLDEARKTNKLLAQIERKTGVVEIGLRG